MTDGADGEQDSFAARFVRQNRFDRRDHLFDRKSATAEPFGGLPVAVGYYVARIRAFVDPCRTQRQQDGRRFVQCAGAFGDGGVDARQCFVRRVARQRTVEIVMEPPSVGVLQLLLRNGESVAVAPQGAHDRQRVEQHARRIDRDAEFGFGHPASDLRGEARAERQQAVVVGELPVVGEDFDFGTEFHRAKIRSSAIKKEKLRVKKSDFAMSNGTQRSVGINRFSCGAAVQICGLLNLLHPAEVLRCPWRRAGFGCHLLASRGGKLLFAGNVQREGSGFFHAFHGATGWIKGLLNPILKDSFFGLTCRPRVWLYRVLSRVRERSLENATDGMNFGGAGSGVGNLS